MSRTLQTTAKSAKKPPKSIRSVDDYTTGTIAVGRARERVVRDFMIQSGFKKVQLNPERHGPDITFVEGGKTKTVEVKPARKLGHQWRTPCISRARLQDDYIAIIFPNHKVVLRTMKEHLGKGDPESEKSISGLARLHCPELFEEV